MILRFFTLLSMLAFCLDNVRAYENACTHNVVTIVMRTCGARHAGAENDRRSEDRLAAHFTEELSLMLGTCD